MVGRYQKTAPALVSRLASAVLSEISYFVTNEQASYRPNQDVVANCLLRSVATGYFKVIVNAKYLSEFTLTPHDFSGDVTAPVDSIYIGHYWIKELRDPQGQFRVCHEINQFVAETARDSLLRN